MPILTPPEPASLTDDPAGRGALAPLRHRTFRWLWIAGVGANVGTWMHEVGAGWLMAHAFADDKPRAAWFVSLLAAATTLPMLLLSFPAGVLADVFNRRRIMLVTQACMLVLAGGLGVVAWTGHASPWVLLLVTFALGIGASVTNPAWQSAMTEIVPSEELPAASALNSVSLNVSRAVGPAIAGALIARWGDDGAATAFVVRAVAVAGLIVVLWRWVYTPSSAAQAGTSEGLLRATFSGLVYVRQSRELRAVLVRTVSFVLCASVVWALAPVIARNHLGLEAGGYGLLLASLGTGAVAMTAALPRVRRVWGVHRLIVGATLVFAGAVTLIALTHEPAAGVAGMALAGAGWVTMVVLLNVSAQTCTPPGVRGRALAAYFTVFFGSMAVGSPAWGAIAHGTSIATALLIAAGGLLMGLLTLLRWRLTPREGAG